MLRKLQVVFSLLFLLTTIWSTVEAAKYNSNIISRTVRGFHRRISKMMGLEKFDAISDVPKEYFVENKYVFAFCERVIDGDTIRVRHLPSYSLSSRLRQPIKPLEQRGIADCTLSIRIYGVDCPEMAKNMGSKQPAQPFAQEAKQFTSDQVLHRVLKITFLRKDQYHRGVCVVETADETNGKDLSVELAKAGLAELYTGGGAEYFNKRKILEGEIELARRRNLGIWSLGSARVGAAEHKRNGGGRCTSPATPGSDQPSSIESQSSRPLEEIINRQRGGGRIVTPENDIESGHQVGGATTCTSTILSSSIAIQPQHHQSHTGEQEQYPLLHDDDTTSVHVVTTATHEVVGSTPVVLPNMCFARKKRLFAFVERVIDGSTLLVRHLQDECVTNRGGSRCSKTDASTSSALSSASPPFIVRVHGVDCPKSQLQPRADEARRMTEDLVLHRVVRLRFLGNDKHKRAICTVKTFHMNGDSWCSMLCSHLFAPKKDLSIELTKAGLTDLHVGDEADYRNYKNRRVLEKSRALAQQRKVGIWSSSSLSDDGLCYNRLSSNHQVEERSQYGPVPVVEGIPWPQPYRRQVL